MLNIHDKKRQSKARQSYVIYHSIVVKKSTNSYLRSSFSSGYKKTSYFGGKASSKKTQDPRLDSSTKKHTRSKTQEPRLNSLITITTMILNEILRFTQDDGTHNICP